MEKPYTNNHYMNLTTVRMPTKSLSSAPRNSFAYIGHDTSQSLTFSSMISNYPLTHISLQLSSYFFPFKSPKKIAFRASSKKVFTWKKDIKTSQS
eukprot:TRINITY_DN24048_c0_g1_i1.p1 TRINITY_DN24048_c0_g1~~TRINITY_DN24048_c0_g1_i1.p1  ORF type:complete len:102 (-),score=3.67 TRINITY_DN24048_c0_g1_i1:87-371(-)